MQRMKPFGICGAVCSGQNRATTRGNLLSIWRCHFWFRWLRLSSAFNHICKIIVRVGLNALRNQYSTRVVVLRSCLCFLTLIAGHSGFAQQFQVDGELLYYSWNLNGTPLQERASRFDLCVSNCDWKMEITPKEGGGQTIPPSHLMEHKCISSWIWKPQ
jgi:hypothetical protein